MLQLFTSVSRMALLLLTLTPSSAAAASSSLAAESFPLGAPEKSLLEAAALVGEQEELYNLLASFTLLALARGERLQLPVPPSWLRVVALSLDRWSELIHHSSFLNDSWFGRGNRYFSRDFTKECRAMDITVNSMCVLAGGASKRGSHVLTQV